MFIHELTEESVKTSVWSEALLLIGSKGTSWDGYFFLLHINYWCTQTGAAA